MMDGYTGVGMAWMLLERVLSGVTGPCRAPAIRLARRLITIGPPARRGGLRLAGLMGALALAASVLSAGPAHAMVWVSPDVARLPAGTLPQLPYLNWSTRRIVDGSRQVSISGIQGRAVELHKVDGGYLLRRQLSDGSNDLVFVSTTRTRKAIVKLLSTRPIRVSMDGGKVVLNRMRIQDGAYRYADSAVLALPSGRVLYARTFGTEAPGLALYGLHRVLIGAFDETDAQRPDLIWWTPATGHTETIQDSAYAEAADLSAWQWAIRPQDGANTYGVRPIPPASGAGWPVSQEDWNIGSWSTDDALLWGNNEVTDHEEGVGSSNYLVFRASDGARLLSIANVVLPWATWESAGALLLRAGYGSGSGRRYQLLRCRLSGACSRVGPASMSLAGVIIPATRRA